MSSKIEWCEETWNPITGCTPISEGCAHCYAERMATRLRGRYGYPRDDPFRVTYHPDRLDQPLRWKKPRRIFVCSMGDIFHENVSVDWLDSIIGVMAQAKRHTFILLTKRPQNIEEKAFAFYHNKVRKLFRRAFTENVWLGVTTENQRRADERIPVLLKIPAAVRFVSVEPLLGPVKLDRMEIGECYPDALTGDFSDSCADIGKLPKIDWVICGGESGPGARPVHPDWARGLRDQCVAAGVPFFFKQWGGWVPKKQLLKDNRMPLPRKEWGTMTSDGEYFPLTTPWNGHDDDGRGEAVVYRMGKKDTGRKLDSRTWDEYPEAKQ